MFSDKTVLTNVNLGLTPKPEADAPLRFDGYSQSAPAPLQFTEETNWSTYLLLLMLVVCVGVFSFQLDQIGGLTGLRQLAEDLGWIEAQETPVVPVAPPVTPERKFVTQNPYWDLPNTLEVELDGARRAWSANEELLWTKGIAHPFPYQRLRTLQEVRKYQLIGSENILRKGLKSDKLWARFEAALAITELGIALTNEQLDGIFANVRSNKVQNFLKRFNRSLAGSEQYLVRALVRLADAQTRLSLLRALGSNLNDENRLFLSAATIDPVPSVAKFAKRRLWQLAVKKDQIAADLIRIRTQNLAQNNQTLASTPATIPSPAIAGAAAKPTDKDTASPSGLSKIKFAPGLLPTTKQNPSESSINRPVTVIDVD